jgi:hypothetical protein
MKHKSKYVRLQESLNISEQQRYQRIACAWWRLGVRILTVGCNQHCGQRHQEQHAEQHRTVEYPGGNFDNLVRRPLQEISPFGIMVVGCNQPVLSGYCSERSFSKDATEVGAAQPLLFHPLLTSAAPGLRGCAQPVGSLQVSSRLLRRPRSWTLSRDPSVPFCSSWG